MASSGSRLGRGLDSLISGGIGKSFTAKPAPSPAPAKKPDRKPRPKKAEEKPLASGGGFLELPLSKIEPNPYQPRKEAAQKQIEELAESIRSEGLLQPVVVRPAGERFQLIAGERRLRACRMLKLKRVPARVIEASDASSAVMALIENLQREGLNPIDESRGYASLMRDFDLTQEAVAERVGKGRATVANALRLLQLEKEIQGYISKELLSTGHAKVLLGVNDRPQRSLLARRIIEQKLSVRETEHLIRNMKGRKRPSLSTRSIPETELQAIRDLEKRIASQFSTPVKLKHTPKKGRIEIEYYGNDDLQRILELMGVNG